MRLIVGDVSTAIGSASTMSTPKTDTAVSTREAMIEGENGLAGNTYFAQNDLEVEHFYRASLNVVLEPITRLGLYMFAVHQPQLSRNAQNRCLCKFDKDIKRHCD